MGLDMYLTAEKFFWSNEQGIDILRSVKSKEKVIDNISIEIKKLFPEMKDKKLDYVIFQVGYWRKANHIHKWFVDNVQDGNDDCRKYSVSRDQLKELKLICEDILKSCELIEGVVVNGYTFTKEGIKVPTLEKGKVINQPEVAKQLLPTKDGFFFGNTEYDEYYYTQIKDTIKIIEDCLKLPNYWYFYYSSSW